MADNEENRGKLKKKREKLKTIIGEQDRRLNHLQSSAFQLANFYFVFQGVILTAIANGSSALRHSDIWIPCGLSILAAILNLFSVFVIGLEYLRILEQRDRSLLKCDRKHTELQELKVRSGLQSSNNQGDRVHFHVDAYKKCKRTLIFVLCVVLFLAFAVIMTVACWRVSRSRAAECKHPPNVNGKCIRLCDG